jgi:hypothetical protein
MPRKKQAAPPPIFFDEERAAWDRQPNEVDRAWQAFVLYRDALLPGGIGKRVQRLVSERLYPDTHPTKGRVKEIGLWSVRHRWRERCNLYDVHLDRVKQEEFRAALRKDMETNIAVYRAMRSKGSRKIVDVDPGLIPIRDAIRMVDTAISGLRREAGLATEITGSERDNAFAEWLARGGDPDTEDEPNGEP